MKRKKRKSKAPIVLIFVILLCICAALLFLLFKKKSPDAGTSDTNWISQNSFVLIGDSRTVGIMEAFKNTEQTDSCIYIAKEGEGLDWLETYGLPQLEETLSAQSNLPVVLNLGVNDLGNIDSYLSQYRQLMQQYPDTDFYFMSINPVDESIFYNLSNQDISRFNQSLKTAYPSQYLDCYNYLLNNGFSTTDGLHYTQDTSIAIHQFIVDSIF